MEVRLPRLCGALHSRVNSNQADHSTAGTHAVGGQREFNAGYEALMRHLGMKPRTIGVGAKEQHGDVEALNGALKRRLELLLDTDLADREIASAVGYRRYETWRNAFRRRLGCLPKDYRKTGRLTGEKPPVPTEREEAVAEPDPPRFLAGIAGLDLDSFSARCGASLEPGPAARVFEDREPLCHLCALERAPRELADFLFVHAPHSKRQPRERLGRITEPEKILARFRRELKRSDAGLLIWALMCRYPASAGVVGEIFGLRERERGRLLDES